MRSCIMVASLVAFLLSIATLCAQERQVPFDEEGTIKIIDPSLEKKLALFPGYEEFQEARMYQLPDSSFIVEIAYHTSDENFKQRVMMGTVEAAEFRRKVSQRIREQSDPATGESAGLDQSGRARLLTGTTILGLGYYGWVLPTILDIDDTRTYVGTYMLTTGSTFFIPFLATSRSRVTKAQANMALYGGAMGILHGFLLHGLLEGEDFFDSGSESVLTTTMLTSVAEGVAGYMIAGSNNLSEGKANVITSVGTFGLGAGAAIGYLGGMEDFQGYSGMMLLGTGAGFFAGNAIANTQKFTAGDAEVFAVAGSLGTYVPAMLLYAFGAADDGKLFVGTALVGTAGGLYAGSQLVKGHDFTDSEGDYIALGTIAGGALGVGVAYLMSADGPDAKLYAAASSLGLTGGFWLMYGLLEGKAHANSDESRNWRFDISPGGMAAAALGMRSSRSSASIPVAGFSCRF